MNSIRRPRKRPRVESVSFDSFAWVLAHEVALLVLYPRALHPKDELWARSMLCSVPTATLRRRVRLRLNWRGGSVL